ncbi:hypothetical protein Q8W71_10470 [Methylobacterium sp. NEAU 140]|uniref:hypothetical protein n=1 Tax=Methylobacterium sp. NEAU 140 TaxID=3064945 RepID=UPI002732CB37|nr:hypothetical protein [Methylobacterium sp. NEAU 140]MDP4023048.1 hypothetical protein [Methylobacterium sp. NEAU 140]
MSNRPPPVPPDNRSDKGPGSAQAAPKDTTKGTPDDPSKTGQAGNTAVNTTNKGYQQDR